VGLGSGDFGQVGTEPEVSALLEAAGFEVSRADRSGPMLFFDALRSTFLTGSSEAGYVTAAALAAPS